MNETKSRKVLCADRRHVVDAWGLLGGGACDQTPLFCPDPGRQALDRLLPHTCWQDKKETENPASPYRQVVPYILLLDPQPEGREAPLDLQHVAVYRRPATSGSEERLHGLRSCGFGGHVERQDEVPLPQSDPLVTVWNCVARELEEELYIQRETTINYHGLILDDTNPVGQAHVGLLYVCRLGEERDKRDFDGTSWFGHIRDVRAAEDVIEPSSIPLQGIDSVLIEQFEGWSRAVLSSIQGSLRAHGDA